MNEDPQLKPFPRITDVNSLFALSPNVSDIADERGADGVNREGALQYRFFRGCESAPFIATSDRFQSLNAWYLSEAAFLAYALSPLASARPHDCLAAEETVRARISPALGRMFAAVAARDGTEPVPTVRVFVRSSPLAGIAEPLVDPVQCYAADNGKIGIVAFRGTLPTSVPNWLTDFEPDLVPLVGLAASASGRGPAAAVHLGFRRAALALLDDLTEGGEEAAGGLRQYIKERVKAHPDLRWWFAGHSLGAALATIAAYLVGNVQALYTFGSPRVGDARFAQVFAEADIPHYRLVHHHDIVPHVPIPLPPLFGYEHVGDLKYIEYADEGAVRSDDARPVGAKIFDSPALKTQLLASFTTLSRWCFDEVGRLKIGFLAGSIDGLTDHAPLYYSNILWNSFVKERGRLLGRADP
jgi:hypothetical protein